ncbi:MAG: DNRLRE domain-containing protein [Phycisphaerae bacterium]|nr:DNRLRE domain-containing protein [Phycisphaerae bacterium]
MRVILATASAVAVVSSSAFADIVSLVADRDASLYESSTTELGNGAGQYFFCGRTNNALARRSVLSFDFSSLGAGVVITNATLTLHYSQGQATTTSASLHRALASWTEGPTDPDGNEGAGAPAVPGDVTWTHRSFGGDAWANPGGDFAALASATTLVGPDFGFVTFTSASLAADVQSWLDGAFANDGWFLLGDESGAGTSKRFDSSENGEALFRPTLTIEYVVPAPSAALVLVAALWSRRRRRA